MKPVLGKEGVLSGQSRDSAGASEGKDRAARATLQAKPSGIKVLLGEGTGAHMAAQTDRSSEHLLRWGGVCDLDSGDLRTDAEPAGCVPQHAHLQIPREAGCALLGEGWCLYTVEYYSAINKGKLEPCMGNHMLLETVL